MIAKKIVHWTSNKLCFLIRGPCTVPACPLSFDFKKCLCSCASHESVRGSIYNHLIQVSRVEWWSWCFITRHRVPHAVTIHLAFLSYATPFLVSQCFGWELRFSQSNFGSSLYYLTFTVHIWYSSVGTALNYTLSIGKF